MEKVDSDKGSNSGSEVQPLKRIYLWLGDRIFTTVVVALGITIILTTLGMALVLYYEGSAALNEFGFFDFISGTTWDPAVDLVCMAFHIRNNYYQCSLLSHFSRRSQSLFFPRNMHRDGCRKLLIIWSG